MFHLPPSAYPDAYARQGEVPALSGGSIPAGMRDVQDDTVGTSPLHLEIPMTSRCHHRIESILLGQALPLGILQLATRLIQVFNLETKVMDAAKVRSVGADVGIFLRFEVQNRQVDVPV